MSFKLTKPLWYTLKAMFSKNGLLYDEDRIRVFACREVTFIIILDGHGGDQCVITITNSLEEIIAVFGDNSFDLAILIVFFNIILVLA